MMWPIAILLAILNSLKTRNETLVMDSALHSKNLDIMNQSVFSDNSIIYV